MTMKPLSLTEFLQALDSTVEPAEEGPKGPTPEERHAMDQYVQAFGVNAPEGPSGEQMYRELVRVAERKPTQVATATQRMTTPSTIPTSGAKFRMCRDWDPEDPYRR